MWSVVLIGIALIQHETNSNMKKMRYATESMCEQTNLKINFCVNKIQRASTSCTLYTLSMLLPFNVKYARYIFIIIIYYIQNKWKVTTEEWRTKKCVKLKGKWNEAKENVKCNAYEKRNDFCFRSSCFSFSFLLYSCGLAKWLFLKGWNWWSGYNHMHTSYQS